MLMNNNIAVIEAIRATKELYPEHFDRLIKKRLAGSKESHYPTYNKPEELERVLIEFEWEQTLHSNVPNGYTVYETYLAGYMAYVRIMDEPEGTLFDVHNRGIDNLYLTVSNRNYKITPITYLITRKEQGKNIIDDFHPGPPIKNFVLHIDYLFSLSFIAKAKAIHMGFEWAKIV